MISEKPVKKQQYIVLNGEWRKREGREKEGEKRGRKKRDRERDRDRDRQRQTERQRGRERDRDRNIEKKRDRGLVKFTSINIKYSKVKRILTMETRIH